MMITPRPKDARHKAWMIRLLMAIADDSELAQCLAFKGGTCAAMRGLLNRFSVDLDFDLLSGYDRLPAIRQRFEAIFSKLGVEIKDQSSVGVQFFIKYDAPPQERSTIRIDSQFPPPVSNRYEQVPFTEIDRTLTTQTLETMVANKLVTVLDRWQKHRSIAGRDIYDIHHFFLNGYRYLPEIITERTGDSLEDFFKNLIRFIEKRCTLTQIQQDLNSLLPTQVFQRIYKGLKQETVVLLQDELKRL